MVNTCLVTITLTPGSLIPTACELKCHVHTSVWLDPQKPQKLIGGIRPLSRQLSFTPELTQVQLLDAELVVVATQLSSNQLSGNTNYTASLLSGQVRDGWWV